MKRLNKKAQEEMVGFALIIVIVAVVLLVFLSFALRRDVGDDVDDSYEVKSFIQSLLQHTTDCASIVPNYHTVARLITECNVGARCHDERDSCEVLSQELSKIVNQSWSVGEDRPVKAYILNVSSSNQEIVALTYGNRTGRYKGNSQPLAGGIEILFTAYY